MKVEDEVEVAGCGNVCEKKPSFIDSCRVRPPHPLLNRGDEPSREYT